MEASLQAFLYREGSKAIRSFIGMLARRPRKTEPEEAVRESARGKAMETAKPAAPVAPVDRSVQHLAPKVALPTAEETTQTLKRRLGRELYKAELDLSAGLLIAGKPCDCLENKHRLGIEAEAEELIASDPSNHVYPEILQWFVVNGHKVTVAAIAAAYKQEEEYQVALSALREEYPSPTYDDSFRDDILKKKGIIPSKEIREYPFMASRFKEFRKRVLGTAAFDALAPAPHDFTLEDAKKIAAEEAMAKVEKIWVAQKAETPSSPAEVPNGNVKG